eukprot:1327360-Rhodomonas_salina.1
MPPRIVSGIVLGRKESEVRMRVHGHTDARQLKLALSLKDGMQNAHDCRVGEIELVCEEPGSGLHRSHQGARLEHKLVGLSRHEGAEVILHSGRC